MRRPSSADLARRVVRVVTTAALAWCACLAGASPVAAATEPPSIEDTPSGVSSADDIAAQRGRVLYETGRLPDGSLIAARRDGVDLSSARSAACVSCHRPSARGGTEGGVRVPPVAGDELFRPGRQPSAATRLSRTWLRHQTRGAYDSASFARALADGVDPDGRALDDAMPRYRLTPQATTDLEAYLRQIGREPVVGIDRGTLHLASVVTPQASAQRRDAVVQTLERWSRSMGFKAYQVRWQLWEVTGPSSQWARQLDARWAEQPVYALLSGAGGHEWEPVHDFCERQRVPCLFPTVDRIPAAASSAHWSMYLGGGVDAEARMLAQRLAARAPMASQLEPITVAHSDKAAPTDPAPSLPPSAPVPTVGTRVLQRHDSPAGASAAEQLRRSLSESAPAMVVVDLTLPQNRAMQATVNDVLVLWLESRQARAWFEDHRVDQAAPRVVLSAQLAPPDSIVIPTAWRSRVVWVSQRSDPVRQAAAAALSLRPWLTHLDLPTATITNDLADVHAATFFFGDAFAQAQGQTQPTYLLERLESATDRRPAGASYFRLSLGPGQRVAAQGGHLLAFKPPELVQLAPLPGWLRANE